MDNMISSELLEPFDVLSLETISSKKIGVSCRYCNSYFKKNRFYCQKCHKHSFGESSNIKGAFAKSKNIASGKMNIKNIDWFHFSTKNKWPDKIKRSDMYVHLGFKSAAQDRARIQLPPKRALWSLSEGENDPAIYTVRLKKDANVYQNEIFNDNNDWPYYFEDAQEYDIQNYDGLLYINRYEKPGSISMLIKADKINIIKKGNIYEW